MVEITNDDIVLSNQSSLTPLILPAITRLLILLVSIVLPACALQKASGTNDPNVQAVTQVITAQDRVNRYLHREVVPRLVGCWGDIEGEGTITVRQNFTRAGGLWVAAETTLDDANLASDQGERALRCFQSAVYGTSFATEKDDEEADTFAVHWSLPVPWPSDIQAVALRMSTNPGGGGGCGGPEAPAPACYTCGYIHVIIGISYCAKSCAGYTHCEVIDHGCKMGPIRPLCVTASPFGNLGGLVPY